ncbi:MAG: heme-binding protein [Cytophagaceae bacterium]|nr:MAG: heme-binding protein [Cytophagaceae bacterium]
MTNAAKAKANKIGVPMNIVIVDEGANLKSFLRMYNAWLGSVDIAQKKARTAVFFMMDTKELSPMVQPGFLTSLMPFRSWSSLPGWIEPFCWRGRC